MQLKKFYDLKPDYHQIKSHSFEMNERKMMTLIKKKRE